MRKLLLLTTLLVIGMHQAKAQHYDVIAYYTGNGEELKRYPVQYLTHIIYSFLHLKGSELAFDNEQSKKDLAEIVAFKKQYPKLKVMISLGGWSGCATCSPVFSTAAGRKTFAASVVRILKETNTDGIDLDWEYPAIEGFPGHAYTAADKTNFTALLQELRQQMGNRYELSFAAGGFTKFLEQSIEWEKVFPLIDRVNLMTYDLINGYSTITGHHTALYSNPQQQETTANCVNWLMQNGYPAHKLVIGAAFYARIWENVPAQNNGLYQPGKFKEAIDYKDYGKHFATAAGFQSYWDEQTKATWLYHPAKKEFATFDDAKSIQAKVDFMKQKQLGGIMFWELKCDAYENGLLEALHQAIVQ
jgi:chitinase